MMISGSVYRCVQAALVAAACGSVRAAAAADEQEYTIRATAGPVTDRPGLRCEGTADLPDFSVLSLQVYFGAASRDRELQSRAVTVEKGRFSRELLVFPERNLSGTYVLRVGFNPAIQAATVRKALGSQTGPLRTELHFQLGSRSDFKEERRRISDRLAGEIRATAPLADELARHFEAGGSEKTLPERLRRALRHVDSGQRALEYKALGLEEIAGPGLRRLRDMALRVAQGAEKRETLSLATRRYLDRLTPEDALVRAANELRTILGEALRSAGDERARARKKFTEGLLALDSRLPRTLHGDLVRLAAASRAFFDADPREAERLRADLDRELEKLIDDINDL